MSTATFPRGDQLFGRLGSWPGVDQQANQLWDQARDLEGWLSIGQARILYRAATLVPDGHWIVEIGSHHGRSTLFLASAKGDEVPMVAVDPFDDPRWGGGEKAWSIFQATLDRFGLQAKVAAFRGTSAQACSQWDPGKPVGLVFVDGAHDRHSVLEDIDGWEDRLAPGGLMIFHDAFSSVGVTAALTQRHLFNRQFRFLGSHRSLAVFQRMASGPAAILLRAVQFCAHYPYFARNIAIKWSLRRGLELPPRLLRYRPGDDLY